MAGPEGLLTLVPRNTTGNDGDVEGCRFREGLGKRSGRLLVTYVSLMAGLWLLYLTWWPGSAVPVGVIGLLGGGAVAAGVVRYRSRRWLCRAIVGSALVLESAGPKAIA
jgi:hypothetical protein